jgi:hypothetical protein
MSTENVFVLKTFLNLHIFKGKISIPQNIIYLYFENNIYRFVDEKKSDS